MSLHTQVVSGAELASYIDALARLRIQVFRDYPYLYDGDLEYEANYLTTYTQADAAMAVLAWDDGQIVGVSTGVPLQNETVEFKRAFVEAGLNLETLFYCGESVLLPAYRGRGTYRTFFSEREGFARDLGLSQSCFCAVLRPAFHPLKPHDYQSLDAIWQHFGYQPRSDLVAHISWKDLEQATATEHPMIYWIKDLETSTHH